MGPPWPKHPCTDSTRSPNGRIEKKATSDNQNQKYIYKPQPVIVLESGWFHAICSNIQRLNTDPTIIILNFGDNGEEKLLYSRIKRDQVDILWPILLKRSINRKYYEISTLNARESIPSEFRFTAFVSVNDLMEFERELRPQKLSPQKNEYSLNTKPVLTSIPVNNRPKLTIDINKIKEIKKKIKLEEKEKRLKEEADKRAEKAIRKAKVREELIKNSTIEIKIKPKYKLSKSQIRNSKKLHIGELKTKKIMNVNHDPIKNAIELAFENAKKKQTK
jgi:hypothetical protein